ncbi:restriction endonuclease subunit S [Vibrio cholerae]|uniref:restriction endonuclease subunit S n=1 Tax=Vibrio cholerae TaxID=666 RepID=UPI0011571AE1|nr:restriction endonuclease subunit S [Vibrio cholerae]MCU8354854.1 restriction endonuclease subunit S [Vibrio vulnificus]TQQ59110.1 restriction endonuclease subunit S [Vibrio cholerae]HDI3302795.1 restriction endonuclease subunit S [Vibrio cholerae]
MEFVTLGDLFKISSGGTPSRREKSYYDNGDIPWIKTGDLHKCRIQQASEYITQLGLDKSSAKLFPKGTVLLAMYGATIGACSILDIEAATNQACAAFLPNEKVDTNYLYYFLISKKNDFIRDGVGGAQPNISATYLKTVSFPLPPLETQKKIAAVLEKADQLRKDCKLLEQELNSLAQSVFIDMFGDPVTNPKGWDKKELLSLCSKVTDGTHQSPEWAETGVPFLFISNVRNGKVDFDTGKYITRRCYEELTRTSPIEVDDILYTTVGSYGHVALVKDNFPDFCFQRHIAHIKPDSNKVIPAFLFYQLQTSGVKHLADLAVKGIAQKTLNLKDLKKFEMIVPPEEKQLELINYMNHQYQALNELEQMKSDYEVLFSSLMQKAFKGELTL